jgi:TPR repeat protein
MNPRPGPDFFDSQHSGRKRLARAWEHETRAMRINAVVSFLLLASLAATPAISQDAAAARSRNSDPVIRNISVVQRAATVDVEIRFSELVEAEVNALEHPDRLVFDFDGCALARSVHRLTVNRGPVLTVRAAVFSVSPPVTRVVIDLTSPHDHEDVYAGNKLIIKIDSTGSDRPLVPAGEGNNSTANSAPLPAPNPDRGSDLALPKSSDVAPSRLSAPPLLEGGRTATVQFGAYALLGKARALIVSDLEPLEAKAQTGDPESVTTLGLAYHIGTLLKLDDAEALRLLRHAANRGFVAAEEAMGIFCQLGFGMPPDKAQAVSWYTKAAQHGARDAATNLALMYSTGDGIPKDSAQSATWFRTAAEAGDATAQLNLGALYHRGDGLPRDDGRAVLWLTKAADQGFLPAMLELARWNLRPEHGLNLDVAIAWLKKAADLGDATAQAELGDIFADQKLGRVDYSQAVTWYRKAAVQGQREGEFGLGARYLLGQGVAPDNDEARRWLTPAANRGHPYAQFLLAKMFEPGGGGPVDAAAAAKYYELAADYGIPEAQYRLGLLLAADRSNQSTLPFAYKWLVLAQDSVKESAATAQELRKSLTPPQIDQAEREIDQWRTAHLRRDLSR